MLKINWTYSIDFNHLLVRK